MFKLGHYRLPSSVLILIFSLRQLCVLCVSAVNIRAKLLIAETQDAEATRRVEIPLTEFPCRRGRFLATILIAPRVTS
jgi:hypothetical protein